MKLFQEMFSETSDISAMRVMSFFSVVVGALIAVIGLFHTKDLSGLTLLCGVFVGPALAGKALQKFAEVKDGK